MATAEAPITIDNPLRRLVGDFKVQKVHGSPDDPDEGGSDTSSLPVFGLRDKLDILEIHMQMDPTELGILTRRVSVSDLHKRDEEAVKLDCELEKRHQ